jgi:ABC-type dipeptide/oligopeptide/nickel transport system permease subunit
MGLLGAGVLVVMVLGCLLTLPYTLGRVGPAGAAHGQAPRLGLRRYEVSNLDRALMPPFWAPHAPDEKRRYQAAARTERRPPRPLLGTDRFGRSLLVRCLAGGGISLGVGLAAAAIAVVVGTVYGMIAGYRGGRTDAVMMRGVDILYGLPYILLVVLLAVAADGLIDRAEAMAAAARIEADAGAAGPPAWLRLVQEHKGLVNIVTLFVAIGGVSWLTMARVIRGQVLSLKAQPFVEASRALGVPLRRQFACHLLPNLLSPIIVYATLTVPAAILSESFLSFLGIGVKEPLPSWGNLAADGLSELNTVRVRWWLLLWPCLFIGITLLALNFVGEALREALDPKRRSVGSSSS